MPRRFQGSLAPLQELEDEGAPAREKAHSEPVVSNSRANLEHSMRVGHRIGYVLLVLALGGYAVWAWVIA